MSTTAPAAHALGIDLLPGLALRDPFMIGSSHWTDNENSLKQLAKHNPSAVTLKTTSAKKGGDGKAGVSGSVNDRTSAGGIGGLLGMYDTNGTSGTTADDKSYHYFYDANGNVGQVLDLAGTGGGGANLAIAVKYEYDPYGNRVNTPGGGELDQPFRFSTKYFDAQTAMYYYGYRYYLPGLGRWASRDPIGELGGMNLNRFTANEPTVMVDPVGMNLYAVDGTWADWNEGTNTEWIYRLTREVKRYWNGPDDGVSGLDARGICHGVFNQICTDVKNAIQNCTDPPSINLVGWSRGAAIATWVSHRLAREGCCVKRAWWGGCTERVNPEVNWLGLFDAVDMSPAIPDWAMVAPPNVRRISHAVKTGADIQSRFEFPTAEIAPWTYFWRHDGSPTTHGDIGANMINNNAFFWMREEARSASVHID